MAPKASAKVTDSFTKINEALWTLYAPAAGKATLDIVFFHGLQFDNFEDAFWKTWLVRDSEEEIWPRKWLSEREDFSQARMLSVSYNSSATNLRGQLRVDALAENLISDVILGSGRVGQDCPVILVGHSWGGLVIKRLVVAALSRKAILERSRFGKDEIEKIIKFLDNIRGVYYYATPHHGSRLADLGRTLLPRSSPILELLGTLNNDTAKINNDFRQQRTIPAAAVAEGLDMPYGGWWPCKVRVVTEASARSDIDDFYTNTTANHITVCKAESANSTVIERLAQFMSRCLSLGEGVTKVSDLPTPPSGLPGSNHAGTSNQLSDDERLEALRKSLAVSGTK